MSDDWPTLCFARFRPAQVEEITGVSVDLQRKWIERHFDFHDWPLHFAAGSGGAHRRYRFAGVQMMAVFGDIMRDVGRADVAKAAILRPVGPAYGETDGFSSDRFEVDLRANGDFFLVSSFSREGPPTLLGADAPNLARLLGESWAPRAYVYNFSAMQRRLAERALPMVRSSNPRAQA
jgi:hypothetical protein